MPTGLLPSPDKDRPPLDFFIAPNCGLVIDFLNEENFDYVDPTDSYLTREYRILNYGAAFFGGKGITPDDNMVNGCLSPIDVVTWTPHYRVVAGVPMEAQYLAHIMPPHGLSKHYGNYEEIIKDLRSIDCLPYPKVLRKGKVSRQKRKMTRKVVREMMSPAYQCCESAFGENALFGTDTENEDDMKELLEYQRLAVACFSTCGGYAFFDQNMKFLQINANVLVKTEYKLAFEGPFKTPRAALKDLHAMKRDNPCSLEIYLEAGMCATAWTRQNETFQGKSAATGYSCHYGAMVFFCDDGSGITYVMQSRNLEGSKAPQNDCHSLSDTFLATYYQSTFNFSHKIVQYPDDIRTCRKRLEVMLKDLSSPNPDLRLSSIVSSEVSFPALHSSLKAKASISNVRMIIENDFDNFLVEDAHGFYPLHYACRFSADDVDLFELLIDSCPAAAVVQPDRFNRYPLHIACDSNPSPLVIKMLLETHFNAKDVVKEKTKYTESLPLHIACNAGADAAVIKALLEADISGNSIRAMTKTGRRALHIAIDKRLPYDAIYMLIEAEKELNICNRNLGKSRVLKNPLFTIYDDPSERRLSSNMTSSVKSEISDACNPDDSIYQWYHGMLPLHLALSKKYDLDVIKLLVNRDASQLTLVEQLLYPESVESEIKANKSTKKTVVKTDSFVNVNSSSMMETFHDFQRGLLDHHQSWHGVRAIHLALVFNLTDTARFLLQKESQVKLSSSERQARAEMRGERLGMTCLHLACYKNHESDIIKLLLDLDPSRVTTTLVDKRGKTPLHHACSHKDARKDVIQMLLDAETKFRRSESKNSTQTSLLSTSVLCDQGKNPLAYATKAEATNNVLQLLLQPKYFEPSALDEAVEKELARRIASDADLQKAIVLTLSKRDAFAILMVQLIVYLLASISFFVETENFYKKDSPTQLTGVLCVCTAFFILREIIQLVSEKSNYFLDVINFFEICNVITLIMAINRMENHETTAGTEIWLMAAATLLVMNLIFFLRSTFLPFSRFAQGLIVIFATLIPFFVVSSLLLMIFAYWFRLHAMFRLKEAVEVNDGNYTHVVHERFLRGSSSIGEIEEACEDSFDLCLYAVLNGFFSGTESTQNFMEILFGLVIVLVLLNVVIAIVSDAWENAKDEATVMYWRGRLSSLTETSCVKFLSNNSHALFNIIDGSRVIFDDDQSISWTKDYPYNLVRTKEQYSNPHHYFYPYIAQQIMQAHSFKSDLTWLQKEQIRESVSDNSEVRQRSVCKNDTCRIILKWVCYSLLYYFWIILGFFTFGILWPARFRVWLLSFGITTSDCIEESIEEKLTRIEQKIQSLESISERLETNQGKMNNADEAIDSKIKRIETFIDKKESSFRESTIDSSGMQQRKQFNLTSIKVHSDKSLGKSALVVPSFKHSIVEDAEFNLDTQEEDRKSLRKEQSSMTFDF